MRIGMHCSALGALDDAIRISIYTNYIYNAIYNSLYAACSAQCGKEGVATAFIMVKYPRSMYHRAYGPW